MTAHITIEPAREMRPEFAMWAITQKPPINTSSASSFDVPVDLYPTIPQRLLNGAYVDGYHYNRPSPQPMAAEPVVVAPVAAEVRPPLTAEPKAVAPTETTAKAPTTRKRNARARKAAEE